MPVMMLVMVVGVAMAVLGAPARCGSDFWNCFCCNSHRSRSSSSSSRGCAMPWRKADGVVALEREVPDAAALGARAARLLLLGAVAVERRQHAAQLCHRVGRRGAARPALCGAQGRLARARLLLRRVRVEPNRLGLCVQHTTREPPPPPHSPCSHSPRHRVCAVPRSRPVGCAESVGSFVRACVLVSFPLKKLRKPVLA